MHCIGTLKNIGAEGKRACPPLSSLSCPSRCNVLQETSKAVMSILTGHGMKMVLPAVLAGLSETAWRSKQVGASAARHRCACLPRVRLSTSAPCVTPPAGEHLDAREHGVLRAETARAVLASDRAPSRRGVR
jgi:hypothetical protein